MTDNLTRTHKLVEDITSTGWLANPAGRQGYEVILLEKVGDGGTRFYHSLKAGETLRISERLFGKYVALAVDVRHARSFPIDGEFQAQERGRKVKLKANIRYRVIDARVVAMETVDPLGELRDKVIATLNRELIRYQEVSITPEVIERVVRSVGTIPHLGLVVEDADTIEFVSDPRLTQQSVQAENLKHELSINDIKQRAEIEAESNRREAEIRWKVEKHAAYSLTDLNTLLHEYPDMIPSILTAFSERERRILDAKIGLVAPAIQAYIEQRRQDGLDIDPTQIARMLSDAIATERRQLQGPMGDKQVIWGDATDASLSDKSQIKFSDEKNSEEGDKKPSEDNPRIKFSE